MANTRLSWLRLPASMRPALSIMAGRTLGFVAAFAIPLVLARCFDRGQFATYRQLFLMYATGYGIAQLGMAESLYFFLPRHPERAGRWIANALIVLGTAGIACVAAAAVAAPWVAHAFRNEAVTHTLPVIAIVLALTLVATPLEIVMVSRHQHRLAAGTFAASDIARAVLLTIPALVTGRLDALLAGAIVFGVLRCGLLAVYLRRELPGEVRLDRALLAVQLKYAVPFGAAVAIGVVQLNFHQYAVAAWFDPATFAIYSVGCLQIPLVDILTTSVANVMMVTMGDQMRRQEAPLALWQETVGRLAFVFVPLSILLMICAHDVIVTLFTSAYAGSAVIFTAFATTIALAALPVDAVLRAHAETRFLLWMNVLQLIFVASTIGWFVSTWHLLGAVLVTVAAMALAKTIAVCRIARIMRVGLREILPWRQLAGTLAAALVAAGLVMAVRARLAAPPFVALVVSGTVYALGYLAVAAGARVLHGSSAAPEPEAPAA